MKKIITVLAFGCLFFTKIQAQILPPDFLCVRGDTLFWDVPVNTCGPFNGYEVWASQNVNGPYTLQATVTNQAQDFFAFINPSGQQWFFYLVSNYNCPGQMALPSDTLDNRPPEVSPIESASVESGLAVVTWQPSPSPEVFAYVIYRETPIGVIPIDTVFSGNTFTDLNSNPETASESYFVNALDRCGNTSIFDLKHTTIFLTAAVNPCRQSVSLNWNTYQNWPNGIGEQQIWVSENGGALVPKTDAGTGAAGFEYGNVTDGAAYCFVLQAVEAVTGNVAKSNQVCVTADIVQSVEGLYLRNVTVGPADEVEVTWVWNTTAEVNEVQVLSSNQNAGYQQVVTQTPQPPLTAVNTLTDNSGAAG
ncbi:MAG: hypothetical protein HY842_16585, partial [Bacteroidetes bacterium]|nr:hypothetical protein [Bacteroidota bacterium]